MITSIFKLCSPENSTTKIESLKEREREREIEREKKKERERQKERKNICSAYSNRNIKK
jgi:hypothetical protein